MYGAVDPDSLDISMLQTLAENLDAFILELEHRRACSRPDRSSDAPARVSDAASLSRCPVVRVRVAPNRALRSTADKRDTVVTQEIETSRQQRLRAADGKLDIRPR